MPPVVRDGPRPGVRRGLPCKNPEVHPAAYARNREQLSGIDVTDSDSSELQFVVGTDVRDEETEAPPIWTCLNFMHVVPGRWRDPEASLQTDAPGMRTIHAQFGRILALVRSGDTRGSETQPGFGPQRVCWRAQGHHLDDCPPWCGDHCDEGWRLRMTPELTTAHGAENRVYEWHESAGATTDLLAAQAT
jgi:hypothetical protein